MPLTRAALLLATLLRATLLRAPLLLTTLLLTTLLLAGCGRHPTDALTWRESWEMLVITRDGGLVDARVTVSNTGLLRAQGHLQADRWSEDALPILYSRDAAPAEVQVDPARRSVHLGMDGLAQGEDPAAPATWTLRARDDQASVLLHLHPLGEGAAPRQAWQAGGGQWAVEAPVPLGEVSGWFGAQERGGLVEGWGALLHRGGDGWPAGRRLTLLVAGRDVGLVLDTQGEGQLSWAQVEGEPLALGAATVELAPTLSGDAGPPGTSTVRFAEGVEVELRLGRAVAGRRLLYEHLLGAEQRLLHWTGQWRERRTWRGWARVRWQGQERVAGAALVIVDRAPWQGPVRPVPVGRPGGAEAPALSPPVAPAP
ncbi:hypothetical protein L6R53_18425 [Myxococcota bacterium]|nr:hypothetical protein [Myxococcota bacterium]